MADRLALEVDGVPDDERTDALQQVLDSMMRPRRDKAHKVLSGRDIQSVISASFRSTTEPKEVGAAFSFSEEMGVEAHSCDMAMVVTVLGQELPYAATFPIGDVQELDRVFNEEFDFSLDNQLLVYRHSSEWKVYGQREDEFCGRQDEFNGLWQTFHKI